MIADLPQESSSPGSITNLGQSVSEAAKLHKMLEGASEAEINDFKVLFHQYKQAVKEYLGIGQGYGQDVEQKLIQQEFHSCCSRKSRN